MPITDPSTGQPAGWDLAGPEASPPPDPAWTPPDVYTAAELCELDAPDAEPVLGPILSRGSRLVVGGRSGDGKTTMVMQMLKCIVLEQEFLGWRGDAGRCLVLDLEQGRKSAQRSLTDAGLDECDAVDYVMQPDGLSIESNEVQREWLINLLARGYSAVALDPLYKLHGADTNDERAMINLCRLLDRWRSDLHFGLIIPMHLRKADTRGDGTITMDDIFGSGALTRGAEIVLGLRALENGRARLHFWKDRDGDLARTKWLLSFSREEGFRRLAEDATTGGVSEDAMHKAFMGIGGWCTRKELIEYSELSDSTVGRIIRKWKGEQIIEVRLGGHGREEYRIPVIGDNEAERYEALALEESEKWE